MRAVVDHRFEGGAWPIDFVIKAKDATPWMAHLYAECQARGWQATGLSQIDSAESSGSLSLHTKVGADPPTLEIAWEKTRDKALRVRARVGGNLALPLATAREFFATLDTHLFSRPLMILRVGVSGISATTTSRSGNLFFAICFSSRYCTTSSSVRV